MLENRVQEQQYLDVDELDTPLGRLTLVADAAGQLCLVGWIDGHERARWGWPMGPTPSGSWCHVTA